MTQIDRQNEELRIAISDHFLHIREPESLRNEDSSQTPQPYDFLKEYEEAFMLDANYYSNHTEHLSRFERGGFLGKGLINHIQWQTDADPLTVWEVEMKLDNPKDRNVKIPRSIAFAKIMRSYAPEIRNRWVTDYAFRYNYIGDGRYDTTTLRNEVLTVISITTNPDGLISHVDLQARDEFGSKLMQVVDLSRDVNGPTLQTLTPLTRSIFLSALDLLPFEKVEYHKEQTS